MDGWIILADAAVAHPDGTISILRAGTDRFRASGNPIPCSFTIVARVQAEMAESGQHRFSIRSMDLDGNEVLPRFDGSFEVPKGGGNANFVISVNVLIPKFGDYCISLLVDSNEKSRVKLKTEKLEAGNDSRT